MRRRLSLLFVFLLACGFRFPDGDLRTVASADLGCPADGLIVTDGPGCRESLHCGGGERTCERTVAGCGKTARYRSVGRTEGNQVLAGTWTKL
jgi:hypothetical protein